MANLKELKLRIRSVKSTQKITKAMKMVAAAKLRRARERAEAAAPYADRMGQVLLSLASKAETFDAAPKLLTGTGKSDVQLLVVMTSDRGLCGAFNGSIVRAAKRRAIELQRAGKQVKILCIGSKGSDQLRHGFSDKIIDKIEGLSKKAISYADAEEIAFRLTTMFEAGEFDVCTLIFNRFKSAIAQEVTLQQVIPLDLHVPEEVAVKTSTAQALYEYEPSEEDVLSDLLPRNLAVQVYHAFLENAASEQGARMTAMDNATRNAGDMIKGLTLVYNRTRQAVITKELIEIISGAEAAV